MDHQKSQVPPPISLTWREWLKLYPVASSEPGWDAIVVGSGYGGSVAALRLVEKGYRVLLLERGSEYLAGEFPSDMAEAPKFFRGNIPGAGAPVGRATGLVEFQVGQGIVSVTGNGLGGGSLVNAGVTIQPDEDVFSQPEWPQEIRCADDNATAPSLAQAFKTARINLEAQPWQSGRTHGAGAPVHLLKTAALQRLAGEWHVEASGFKTPDLTIDPAHCTRCGDCAAGCNVPLAKRSLDQTYLRQADQASRKNLSNNSPGGGTLQIITQAEVYRFKPPAFGSGSSKDWTVTVFSTDEQGSKLRTREVLEDRAATSTVRHLEAPLLFICAGTYGSTQLLQRSQALSRDTLSFSATLGQRLSANGDSLSVSANEAQRVNCVGLGAQAEAAFHARSEDMVGPTITGIIDLRDPDVPLPARLLVEEAAIPRAISQMYRELLGTVWTLNQLDRWWYDAPRGARGGGKEDPLSASLGLMDHTQVLLTMGHDGSPGRLVWMEGDDCTAGYVPEPGSVPGYQFQQQQFDKIPGHRHMHSPLWQALPESATSLMSGAALPKTIMTVHPLGGCVMGDHPRKSVVNHLGQVWVGDPGRWGPLTPGMMPPAGQDKVAQPRVYEGLYVLDGSIIPTSLGCNPFLTITALAERAMVCVPQAAARNPQDEVPKACKPRTSPPREPKARASEDIAIDAVLAETLTAEKLPLEGAFAQAVGATEADSRFEAKFTTKDFSKVLRDSAHQMDVRATLVFGKPGGPECLRYTTEGAPPPQFSFLLPNPSSSGAGGLIRAGLVLGVALVLAIVPACKAGATAYAWLCGVWPAWVAGSLSLLVAAVVWVLAAGLVSLVGLTVFHYPLISTLLAYVTLRWWRDRAYKDAENRRKPVERAAGQRVLKWVAARVSGFKQMLHASEARWMHYRVPMVLVSGNGPEKVTFFATKRVAYFPTWSEWGAWLQQGWGQKKSDQKPVPLRPTYWEQIMNAHGRVVEGHPKKDLFHFVLAQGQWSMGFDNLLERGRAMQMGQAGDAVTGLATLAGYPMMFIRFAIKTRLLDMRLPSYSGRPVPDNAGADEHKIMPPFERELPLRLRGGGTIAPDQHWVDVARGHSSNDQGVESSAPLKLQLWRYRRTQDKPLEVAADAQWMGMPVTRVKSVLLLHAFGQSGLTYTFKQTDQNLAEAFYARGYEVWILDSRMSTRSGYADEPFTVDMMAREDIPKTVEWICDTLDAELHTQTTGKPVQISVFAQCIGAASAWMALLDGGLSHRAVPLSQKADGPDAPQLSRVSHMMCSQVHPWIVGSRLTQAKTWVPALVNSLTGGAAIPFAVRGEQGLAMQLVDRVLASMPAPLRENEKAMHSGGGDLVCDDAAATFRRIRFVEAPLVHHENINDETYRVINRLFGDANIRLFMHARRFVEWGRLVDEDGQDCYVTDANIRKHLAFPIQLMHGVKNELFDVRSAKHSFMQMERLHGGWQKLLGLTEPLLLAKYGHLDGLIGEAACKDVYPHVVTFFEQAFLLADHSVECQEVKQLHLRPPRLGPFVGWVRQEQGALKIRVSFVVDNEDGSFDAAPGTPPDLVVRRWNPGLKCFVTLTGGMQFSTWHRTDPAARNWVAVWGDIACEGPGPGEECFQILTKHVISDMPGRPGMPLHAPGTDQAIDDWIAGHAPTVQPVMAKPEVRMLQAQDFSQAVIRLQPSAWQGVMTPIDETRFAASCCRYPGLGLDRYRVDDSVRKLLERGERGQPSEADQINFCLLVGDQIYADATAGLIDGRSPSERYFDHHEDAFGRDRQESMFAGETEASSSLHALLSSVPTYMTPDDHEWVNNYPLAQSLVMEPWMDQPWNTGHQRREQLAWNTANEAVTAFQRLQSPLGAAPRAGQGWYTLDQGCVRVFVMDTRMDRQSPQVQVVNPAALTALQSWLAQPGAAATLNVVVSGTVALPNFMADTDPANPGGDDNWSYAPAQRQRLFDTLVGSGRRFVLLSGDYHLSCMLELQVKNRCGGNARTVGAAIVTPPLYAPLPMVNATPDFLNLAELIQVPGGDLSMAAVPGGCPRVGSGYAMIDVKRHQGGFLLECKRQLRDLQSGGVWEAPPLVGSVFIP